MILDKNNEFEAFEIIKEYIFYNQIKELYGDAKVVSEAINNKFESTIITTIDLSIETLLVTKKRQDWSSIEQSIQTLERVRKMILGTKYDYIQKLKVED